MYISQLKNSPWSGATSFSPKRETYAHWNRALDDGHSVRILFIDYAKAFDHVDHNLVIQKLKALGVPDFMVRWLSSFLRVRQQRVKVIDIFSD